MYGNKAYLNCMGREQAQQLWWKRLEAAGYFISIPTERIAVTEALGRVTAECLYAEQSVPHYNGSAMDGIAVRAEDTFGASDAKPLKLNILKSDQAYQPGDCYIVDTGDLLPEGTNAVVMIEDTHIAEGQAEITAAAAPWQHVRIIGEDIVEHELILPEHHVITPVDIAALLAAGLEEIETLAKPIVTVIPTGTELVADKRQLKPGAILDVNSHMLCAAVSTWGAAAKRHDIVPDDYQMIKQAVSESLSCSDMVVMNAGTSAGTEDYTAKVLAELGEVLVHGVAIKPGKPVVLAICQGKPVIGLPGYPVSAMLTAELFVREIVTARQKLGPLRSCSIQATLAKQVYSNIGVEEYIRVSLGNVQGKTIAAPLGRGASLISSLTRAHGLLSIGEANDGISAGSQADVILFGSKNAENNLLAVGSHDLALDLLGVYLTRSVGKKLSCSNVGSMGGVMAARNGEAHIAGIHMLDEQSGIYNTAFVKKYLADSNWQLVHLAMREQGLMVAPGNPKQILTLADLVRPDVLFVNRQRGSGTRMLLDYQLKRLKIDYRNIKGYEKEVGTHMAVGATIVGKSADVGLGIRAAARALGLDFIPIAQEQYDIILNFPASDDQAKAIIEILNSSEFRRDVEALGGYDLSSAGKIISAGGQ